MSKTQLTFSQVFPLVKASLACSHTPALLGEAGIGKSSLINDLEREFKTKVFTLAVNQLADRSDLTGVRMVETEKGSWSQKAFPHFTIMEAIEYATDHPDEHPILFMDEFNRASSDITSAVLSLQTERKIGAIKFPDNLRMMVAGNDAGNVTALDEASTTRFVLFHVVPDLETFMSIQTLNPYVKDVLSKFPDDLMAKEAINQLNENDSSDDDEENVEDLAQYEFLSEDNFTQKTRPRTITSVSQWLDSVGLDKTGSDAERQLLGDWLTDVTDNSNVLMALIEAYVGQTTFAYHLYDEINNHFNALLSNAHTSNAPLLGNIRPDQTIINALSRAQDVQQVEDLINNIAEPERLDTLIWLTEAASTKEINNNKAVEAYMTNAPHHIDQFDNKAVQNLMRVLTDTNRVSQVAITAMIASSAPVMNQWRTMIQSVME